MTYSSARLFVAGVILGTIVGGPSPVSVRACAPLVPASTDSPDNTAVELPAVLVTR